MSIDANILKTVIAAELAGLSDERIIDHIRAHLIEPAPELKDWDWGDAGQQYPCWIVFTHASSNTGIAYCEHGFGPRCPWGLLWIGGEGKPLSMGQDSAWFTSFMETYFNSMAVSDLPIWRVFEKDGNGKRTPISGEGGWDEMWAEVLELRKRNPERYFDCASDAAVRYLYE